jgi:hypothetical protein
MPRIPLDPVIALSLSLVSNRGVYALLLGSGVSRAARIPTGWEVTLDLIRKVAAAQAADCADDPAAWYRNTYKDEPDYSDLLNQLGKSPEERSQLLRGYFEPTDDEREQGWKQPTKAHRAIAQLVSQGHVKLILTTNFDRLLERAIEDAGVTPTVISTPEGIAGSLPLIHQRCCIVKLHGDYLDTRIKNTPEELAKYHKSLDRLLNQVFDEFGLIVSGWSGVWDTALRSAIERCPSRRFATYWTSVSDPAKEAAELFQRRGATLIRIKDADTFFQDLADKAEAIEASSQPHPMTTAAAVASLKKFIAEDRFNIRLHDLLFDETERVYNTITDVNKANLGHSINTSEIPVIYGKYRDISKTLIELFIHGCFWSRPQTDSFFVNALQQVGRKPLATSGPILNDGLRHYPVLLCFYAGGIAAVGSGNYDLLAKMFCQPTLRANGTTRKLIAGLNWSSLIDFCKAACPNKYAPLSEHLFLAMREPMRQYFSDDGEFEDIFDRYEYLQSLVVADFREKAYGPPFSALMGRFAWKAMRRAYERSVLDEINEEVKSAGADWPPLKAGLFDGSVERLHSVRTGIDERISKLEWY